MPNVIALVTDFGTRDSYVGAMKGVLVTGAPQARIVDITHEVPPGDVLAANWVLASAWRAFPEGTVFLCVVDPGVGSPRRAIAFEADGMFGVGPDNGLWTMLLADAERVRAVELTNRALWRHPTSPVFHGRDIFAPVAAALARGTALDEVGDEIEALRVLPVARPTRSADGRVAGHVIHVDRFGNVVTDVRAALLPDRPVEVRVGAERIRGLVRYYAEAPEGELVALVNSAGYLEVAKRGASAAAVLGIQRGDPVEVRPAG